ncbi:MAG TPA: hypothetical protein VH877_01830 [Polyangia bacterium]|jgi:hypothetical protein|nr:hypothetical protein [Polyangia bacterium]
MNRSWWWVSTLATSLLLGACARQQVRQDEAQLGRLPIEEKQEIFTAQHNVTVAEANKAAADKAAREMQAFVKNARDDVSAARARLQASRSSLQLGRRTNNAQTLRIAEQQNDIARRQLAAAQAKREYAQRLSDLRNEQVKLAARQIDAAQAELALVRASVLQRNNVSPGGESVDKLRQRREQATAELAQQERKVSGLRDEANDLQMVWEQRRQDYNVASRDVSGLPPLPPPSSPEQFRPEPIDVDQNGQNGQNRRNDRNDQFDRNDRNDRVGPGQDRQVRPRSNMDQGLDDQRQAPPPGASEPSDTSEPSDQGLRPDTPSGDDRNIDRPRPRSSQDQPSRPSPRQARPGANVPTEEGGIPDNGNR